MIIIKAEILDDLLILDDSNNAIVVDIVGKKGSEFEILKQLLHEKDSSVICDKSK